MAVVLNRPLSADPKNAQPIAANCAMMMTHKIHNAACRVAVGADFGTCNAEGFTGVLKGGKPSDSENECQSVGRYDLSDGLPFTLQSNLTDRQVDGSSRKMDASSTDTAASLIGEPPEVVAGRLRHLPGFVFLDSSSEAQGAVSIITALPDEVLTGHISHPEPLKAALEQLKVAESSRFDLGFPRGGLFGSVDFDGSYTFGRYSHVLVFHHDSGDWTEVGDVLGAEMRTGDRENTPTQPIEFQHLMGQNDFCARVRKAQDYIAAGDIYQVNLAHRFSGKWQAGRDAFDFYRVLRDRSPSPMGAFLHLGDRQVLSTSPESFLKMSGRWVQTRPIKGTRPRFADEARDALSAIELQQSEKEAAELVMITDLERNDLGQVCEFGTVTVPEMLRLEAFEQVYHLISTVEGTLRQGVDHVDALAHCFPGGSISGAPKKRSLEIIAELEPFSRGLYTGAIGYFGANGESHFNIAIRTAVVEGDEIQFHVGSGIVADSDPEKEWQETLHKAAGILSAAGENCD